MSIDDGSPACTLVDEVADVSVPIEDVSLVCMAVNDVADADVSTPVENCGLKYAVKDDKANTDGCTSVGDSGLACAVVDNLEGCDSTEADVCSRALKFTSL